MNTFIIYAYVDEMHNSIHSSSVEEKITLIYTCLYKYILENISIVLWRSFIEDLYLYIYIYYTVINFYASSSVICLIRKFCHIYFPKCLQNWSTKFNCWNIKFLNSRYHLIALKNYSLKSSLGILYSYINI